MLSSAAWPVQHREGNAKYLCSGVVTSSEASRLPAEAAAEENRVCQVDVYAIAHTALSTKQCRIQTMFAGIARRR